VKLCQNTLTDLGILGGFTQLGLHSQRDRHNVRKVRRLGLSTLFISYSLVLFI